VRVIATGVSAFDHVSDRGELMVLLEKGLWKEDQGKRNESGTGHIDFGLIAAAAANGHGFDFVGRHSVRSTCTFLSLPLYHVFLSELITAAAQNRHDVYFGCESVGSVCNSLFLSHSLSLPPSPSLALRQFFPSLSLPLFLCLSLSLYIYRASMRIFF